MENGPLKEDMLKKLNDAVLKSPALNGISEKCYRKRRL